MPITPRRLRALERSIEALTAMPPGPRADRAEAECQRRLLSCLDPGGARSAARLTASLKRCYPQSRVQRLPRLWLWRLERAKPRRALDVSVHSRGIYFSYGKLKEPSPWQAKRHALQDRFYARWLEVGQRAYRGGSRVRLSPDDRLVLLVGELEADVNNGGFDQYLSNQGRRRAMDALAALRGIGARRTAALLAAALDPKRTARGMDALDRRFYRVPDDLAVRVMAHLGPRA